MSKEKTIFFCKECGNEYAKWFGRCPSCGAWESLVEAPKKSAPSAAGTARVGFAKTNRPVRLREIDLREEPRIPTGMKELDRVLGGGIVPGSLVLASGDPGIGKSTLLLQLCRNLSEGGVPVLYVSGEESLAQIKMRAIRIGECGESLQFLTETDIGAICDEIRESRPKVVVIDSVQTMSIPESGGISGGVSQIREITAVLLRLAKEEDVTVFLVGHVTKDGVVAGPKILEHMVDTVLYFEGDSATSYRILRAVKNRFGSTNEIGVFEMCADGLNEVANPSEYLLRGRPAEEPGSAVAVTMEGTRPILVEVQALVNKTSYSNPKRTADGTDQNRMTLLTAVIEKRTGVTLSQCDAFLNVAGGMRVTEPAIDLPIVLALLSAFRNKAIPAYTVAFGEVGLTGEVRSVSQPLLRVREAAKLGYKTCILPKADAESLGDQVPKGIRLVGVNNLRDLAGVL
ncbi:MAG: DNA repair protein RadA [Lachnospiraceae bacterium]|nr:DNA repair protein RadA [Lachnospiraceae bacterium]